MKKTFLLIGSSSEIAIKLIETLEKEGSRIIGLSRAALSTTGSANFTQLQYDPLKNFPKIDEPLDGLVYFPGTIRLKSFTSLKIEDFQEDLEINFLNCVKAVQQYLPNLKLKTPSSIVLLSSVAVKKGLPFHASTSACKGALEAFMRALAAEFAPKIRVNCVAPSLTRSPLSQSFLDTAKKLEASSKRHPMQRIGEPEDIANAISFLLSENSSWITGQTLSVDGGYSCLSLL